MAKNKKTGVCEHRHIDTVSGDNACDYFSAKNSNSKTASCKHCSHFKTKNTKEKPQKPEKEKEPETDQGEHNA